MEGPITDRWREGSAKRCNFQLESESKSFFMNFFTFDSSDQTIDAGKKKRGGPPGPRAQTPVGNIFGQKLGAPFVTKITVFSGGSDFGASETE